MDRDDDEEDERRHRFGALTPRRKKASHRTAATTKRSRRDSMLIAGLDDRSIDVMLPIETRDSVTPTDSAIASADSETLARTDTSDTTSIDSAIDLLGVNTIADDNCSRWRQQTRATVERIFGDFVDGLSETNEHIAQREPPPPVRLNPKLLRRNIARCLNESHGYVETIAGVREFVLWKNPIATMSLFCVYMYLIYVEMLIPTTLLLILLQLGLNWLSTQRNINVGLQFLPQKDVALPKLEFLNSAQLIFDVARRVQVLLTVLADILEKLRALFLWQEPEVTQKFVGIVAFFFCLSTFLSLNKFILVIGFLCGGKAFIMTYTYYRFPRLRYMFDIAYYFYRRLPMIPRNKLARNSPPTPAVGTPNRPTALLNIARRASLTSTPSRGTPSPPLPLSAEASFADRRSSPFRRGSLGFFTRKRTR